MPEDRPVKSAEISVFSHATEDEAKVKKAIMNLVPNIEIEIEESKLSGHFEDPILLFTCKIEHRKEASELLAFIYKRLSSVDKLQIDSDLAERVDESGSIYFRLDKQKAFSGKVVLHVNDPIRVKLKLQLPHKADPVIFLRNHLLTLDDRGEPEG
ncbi:MAG: hypothetical protein NTV15_01540 [Candidatus Bathyarchaeota archaeon]|nr:hypothetical protein [Candidatus Bathyarchaeota archaeon]